MLIICYKCNMNELNRLPEFRKVLRGYKISNSASKILDSTTLILLAAATSSGCNTIIRRLLETGRYHFIVSDTTRRPRVNNGQIEKNGQEYWFKSEPDFLRGLEQGKYLEAEIIHNQQVSGISMKELEKANSMGKIAVADIEIKGVDNILNNKVDAMALFITPPSFNEWQNRIKTRGTMSPQEYGRRLESAVDQFGAALTHDYYTFIISRDVEESLGLIDYIVKSRVDNPDYQKRARAVVQDLKNQTTSLLNKMRSDQI